MRSAIQCFFVFGNPRYVTAPLGVGWRRGLDRPLSANIAAAAEIKNDDDPEDDTLNRAKGTACLLTGSQNRASHQSFRLIHFFTTLSARFVVKNWAFIYVFW